MQFGYFHDNIAVIFNFSGCSIVFFSEKPPLSWELGHTQQGT